jgi:hypothetical protein
VDSDFSWPDAGPMAGGEAGKRPKPDGLPPRREASALRADPARDDGNEDELTRRTLADDPRPSGGEDGDRP